MDFDHLGTAAAQDLREPAGAVAPHVVDDHLEAGILDGLDVDQLGDAYHVGRLGVEVLDAPVSQRLGQWHAVNSGIVFGYRDQGFDLSSPSGSTAPPNSSRTLNPQSSGGLWLAVMLTAATAFNAPTRDDGRRV
jgi:hypothetical protein